MMLRFEPHVRIVFFTEALARVFHLAACWSLIEGVGVVVNSVDDGKHGSGTLHGYSLAIDLDTEGDRPEHLPRLHGYMARNLDAPYDVVLEATHVHVEYDTKRKLPPVPATRV
jgi:hypothetical protein